MPERTHKCSDCDVMLAARATRTQSKTRNNAIARGIAMPKKAVSA